MWKYGLWKDFFGRDGGALGAKGDTLGAGGLALAAKGDTLGAGGLTLGVKGGTLGAGGLALDVDVILICQKDWARISDDLGIHYPSAK
ncbi:hypothetical protein AB1K89_14395 [Sporosarcina sp. 179-K 8C2 HS]|uniref:hypothetical protein n=1 Tax=Sporosarcina sp. 179-K 8C2 HS TaxID=3142387 RepID=UPI00399FE0BE